MEKTVLQKLFPDIRTREQVLKDIYAEEALKTKYESWKTKDQEKFLDFCTGVRGVQMLYDGIFKELMNPETAPENLNEVLSLLLEKKSRDHRSNAW